MHCLPVLVPRSSYFRILVIALNCDVIMWPAATEHVSQVDPSGTESNDNDSGGASAAEMGIRDDILITV